MACLEMNCTACSWMDFGNRATSRCPLCGERVLVTFDEPPDRDEPDRECDEDEEDED